MLKLELQYFGFLMRRTDSLEKTLMLGKIEGKRRMGQQRMRWLDGITDSKDSSLSKAPGDSEGKGSLARYSSWDRKELVTERQEQAEYGSVYGKLLKGNIRIMVGIQAKPT